MKRLMPWGLGLLLFLGSFCTISCSTPQKIKQPENPPITLEFWTLQMKDFAPLMLEMIGAYEKAHPQVKIHWVDVPFSEGEKRALTSMLSPHPPDVINLNPDFSAILASRGTLVDMNQAVPQSTRSQYLPVAWQGVSLGQQAFGLPWYLTSQVTVYNKALLKRAGLSGPPTSYPQLTAMAQTLHQKTQGYLLMPSISEGGRFFRVLYKANIPVWNAQGHVTFADHGAGEALQYWVNLYQQNSVPKESLTETPQGAVDRYQSGTLGMLLSGPNFLNIVRENALSIYQQTGVAPQFPQTSETIDLYQMILVVPANSAHPKQAVDFALFVTNAQNTLKLSQNAPVLPPHTALLQAPQFTQLSASSTLADKGRVLSARQLVRAHKAIPVHPKQAELNQIMDFSVQQALLGKLSATEAMAQAQQKMNQRLQTP